MNALLKDPVFFYGIAFILFIALAYFKGKKPVLAWLDAEIVKIRSELDDARNLRLQAEITLEQYRTKEKEAFAQAESIIEHAKSEAMQLKAAAEADLKAALERHEQQALDRIRRVEADAMMAVRKSLVEMAMQTARNAFGPNFDDNVAGHLIDQAIKNIPDVTTAKAKAA